MDGPPPQWILHLPAPVLSTHVTIHAVPRIRALNSDMYSTSTTDVSEFSIYVSRLHKSQLLPHMRLIEKRDTKIKTADFDEEFVTENIATARIGRSPATFSKFVGSAAIVWKTCAAQPKTDPRFGAGYSVYAITLQNGGNGVKLGRYYWNGRQGRFEDKWTDTGHFTSRSGGVPFVSIKAPPALQRTRAGRKKAAEITALENNIFTLSAYGSGFFAMTTASQFIGETAHKLMYYLLSDGNLGDTGFDNSIVQMQIQFSNMPLVPLLCNALKDVANYSAYTMCDAGQPSLLFMPGFRHESGRNAGTRTDDGNWKASTANYKLFRCLPDQIMQHKVIKSKFLICEYKTRYTSKTEKNMINDNMAMITQCTWQAVAFRACFGEKLVGALAVEVCARSNVIDAKTAVRTVRWEAPPSDLLAWFAWSIVRVAQSASSNTTSETVQFSAYTNTWYDVKLGPMGDADIKDQTSNPRSNALIRAIKNGTRIWEILLLVYSLICAKRYSTAHIVGCLLQSNTTDIYDPLVPDNGSGTNIRYHVIPNELVKLLLSTGQFSDSNNILFVDPSPNLGTTRNDIIRRHIKIQLWV